MAHDPWAEIYHEAKQEVHPTYHWKQSLFQVFSQEELVKCRAVQWDQVILLLEASKMSHDRFRIVARVPNLDHPRTPFWRRRFGNQIDATAAKAVQLVAIHLYNAQRVDLLKQQEARGCLESLCHRYHTQVHDEIMSDGRGRPLLLAPWAPNRREVVVLIVP
jgi:hypothetical protein